MVLSTHGGDSRLNIPPVEGVVAMRTVGELEAAICEGVSRFEQDYMGRGPQNIHTHLLGGYPRGPPSRRSDRRRAATGQVAVGRERRDLLKQVRTHLVETARPILEAMVQEVTGIKVLSLHHDISTVTGEEVVLFTLSRAHRIPRRQEEIATGEHVPQRSEGHGWRPLHALRCPGRATQHNSRRCFYFTSRSRSFSKDTPAKRVMVSDVAKGMYSCPLWIMAPQVYTTLGT